MNKVRLKIRKNTRIPGWVVTLEALVVALAAHGVLALVDIREPEYHSSSTPESPGVTLLTPEKLSVKEWDELTAWLTIRNPTLFSRSDYSHGYAAQLVREHPREILNRRQVSAVAVPPLARIPEFHPLTLPVRNDSFASLPERRVTSQVPAVSTPLAFDGDGAPVALEHLRVPAGIGAFLPSIVRVWNSSGSTRLHLTASCGVTELDSMALRAAAGMKKPGTIIIYWPEPAGTEKTEEAKP